MDPGVPAPAGVPHPGAPAGAGPDLAALLQRSARGDRAAFAALYDATRGPGARPRPAGGP